MNTQLKNRNFEMKENTSKHILAPIPLKRKSLILLRDENCNFMKKPNIKNVKNDIKSNIPDAKVSSSPFKIVDCREIHKKEKNSSSFHKILKNSLKDNLSNNSSFTSPTDMNEFEDYRTFHSNLKSEIDNTDAKDEILSILSTDHNDSEFSRAGTIRSSMPPLRPQNPFLKNFSNDGNDIHFKCKKSAESKFYDNFFLRNSLKEKEMSFKNLCEEN